MGRLTSPPDEIFIDSIALPKLESRGYAEYYLDPYAPELGPSDGQSIRYRRDGTALSALGTEILAINRANGWNVPVPEDWLPPEHWDRQALAGTESEYTSAELVDRYNLMVKASVARYKIPTSLSLIHSEVSEALEEFRKDHRLDHFGEELVDVMIRTIELGAGLGIDLDAAMAAKLAKNRTRANRHGGRLI